MSLRIHGNRLLKTPPGKDTRPTTARVREALFNIWQETLENSHWLDLCAGSGAIGAEALCRGAASVTGIEQSKRTCIIIRQNWQPIAQPHQRIHLIQGDIQQKLPQLLGQTFDHIYFDPPYASNLYQPVLEAIAQYQLLNPTGELAVEHDLQDWNPSSLSLSSLHISRQKTYGSTTLTFFSRDLP